MFGRKVKPKLFSNVTSPSSIVEIGEYCFIYL